MNHRYLEFLINDICFHAGKMAFISGPRQCGKTTMAKQLLKQRGEGNYCNWDETTFRRQWVKDPNLILPAITSHKLKPLIILDELHKAKLWKRTLKGLYDARNASYDILVTGSARLNVYRKGSDSLLGRYYHFRLHPFSVSELLKEKNFLEPHDLIQTLLHSKPSVSHVAQKALEDLSQYGPFPEPLFAANTRTQNLWRRNRVEKIVREDLRDLSRLPELSQVEMLVSLLPERVGQPLSIKGLSEDLEVAYTTIKRWLNYLVELYYCFLIIPYAKSLPRAIKKESKLYLWDYSEVKEKGSRFENLIAQHLLKYCHFLTDTGVGDYDLRYLKNKEKFEVDFLITENKKPFLMIEAKLADENLNPSLLKFMKNINCHYGIQIVMTSGVYKVHHFEDYKIIVISAANFLQFLV
jgi:predicted AAA+ superfamily ATPase